VLTLTLTLVLAGGSALRAWAALFDDYARRVAEYLAELQEL